MLRVKNDYSEVTIMENIGRIILLLGICIALVGGVIMLLTRLFPGLNNGWTIRVGPFTCFFPVVLSIILSIILTIVLNIIIRLGR
jgi:hypothetical protein